MRRNKKKTVTTVEITWETSSKVFVSNRSFATPDEAHPEANKHKTKRSRLLDAAKQFLRGEDDEK